MSTEVKSASRALSTQLVRSLKEGDGCCLEADADVNRASRNVVLAMLEANGQAWLGRINLHGEERGKREAVLWQHKDGETIYTFGSAYVLPSYDDELVRLVLEYDAGPWDAAKCSKQIEGIIDRVRLLGGEMLVWT